MIRKTVTTALMASVAFGIAWLTAGASKAQTRPTVVLEGTLTGKVKLKKNKNYVLVGGVFIKKKLIIQPGTQIFGSLGSFLVIDKGATIQALGTREQPIVFTSAAPSGRKRRGDWGGLIFNGNAPINVPTGLAQGEGGTGQYGGGANPRPAESSGVMRFVRVEYGGFAISPENELNCVAFQGVGSGTDIDFLASLWGGDDGIEMFGGNVSMKHVAVVGAGDDSFDWTFGWSGKAQFVLAQQRGEEADAGIEADNNDVDNNFTPRSSPRIMNATFVGDPVTGTGSTRGILLRRGTAGELRNFVVTGFKNVGLEINGAVSLAQLENDNLQVRGAIFFNNGVNAVPAGADFTAATVTAIQAKGVKIIQADPLLADPFSKTDPDFRPQAGSPALVAANAEAPFANDPFFTAAPYLGAFDGNDDWTLGWVNYVFGN
ncbi:MAG TPA: hypothetical protein VNH22_01575 [Blastocatellia bacterium]|jgi:hypothetical protein|nr:hypothetical protein [Blastocatellia bacterium]